MNKESLYAQNCRTAGMRPCLAYAVMTLCVLALLSLPGLAMIAIGWIVGGYVK